MTITNLEGKVDRILGLLEKLEPAVRNVGVEVREGRSLGHDNALKLAAIEGRLAGIDGRLTGIDGRLQSIPTTWNVIAILAALLFGVAGVVFASARLVQP